MGKIADFIFGKRAADRRKVRVMHDLVEDMALDQVKAEVSALKDKRVALQAVVDEIHERKRGHNA